MRVDDEVVVSFEMAEAPAELSHRRIREERGFADEDDATPQGLFREYYRWFRGFDPNAETEYFIP